MKGIHLNASLAKLTQCDSFGTVSQHRVQQIPPVSQAGLQPVAWERGYRGSVPGASNELDAQAAPPAVLQSRLGRRRPPRGDVVVHEAAARRAEPSGKVDSLGDALVAWGVGRYWAAISDVQLSLPPACSFARFDADSCC